MGAPDDAMEGLQAPFVATHGTLEPFEVPRVVYGTYKRKKDAVIEPLRLALTAGFTAVDTAFVYNNEAAVGKVLADRRRHCNDHGTHVLGWTNADSDLDAVDV